MVKTHVEGDSQENSYSKFLKFTMENHTKMIEHLMNSYIFGIFLVFAIDYSFTWIQPYRPQILNMKATFDAESDFSVPRIHMLSLDKLFKEKRTNDKIKRQKTILLSVTSCLS